jgi:outer membrane immunogenic protein
MVCRRTLLRASALAPTVISETALERHGGTFRLAKVLSKVLAKVLSKVTATIFALALALALGIGSTVHAADIVPRYYAAPPQPYPLAWAGPYVGATLGYEWGSIDNNPTRPSGVAGGSEAGFNWQTGNFVYGGETDFNLSAADDTFAPWKFSNPWFGTVRARAGFAMDNVLIFGSAGLAYGELAGSTSFGPSESHNSFGWTAGLGAEVTFAQHWSAKPSGSISIRRSPLRGDRDEQRARCQSGAARTHRHTLSFNELLVS